MMLYRHDDDLGNRLAAAVISDKLKCHHLPALTFSSFRDPARNFTVLMDERAVIIPSPAEMIWLPNRCLEGGDLHYSTRNINAARPS